MKFQDDCRDFIKKLKAVAKSELSKVQYMMIDIRLFNQREVDVSLKMEASYLIPINNIVSITSSKGN